MLAPRPVKLRSQRDVNLWRIPLRLSLGAIALFGLTLIPDVLDRYEVIHIPPWLTMGSIDDARAILSAMMGAVATVLALIFSVALLVLSMVATLFGPRLLYRFLQDWVTQVTIGLFMGTFIYICLSSWSPTRTPSSRFIPQISLLTSWVLVVGSFGFLVYYSHRIATSIQNPDMIARDRRTISTPRSSARTRAPPARAPAQLPDDDAILRRAEAGASRAVPEERLPAAPRSRRARRGGARRRRADRAQVPPGPVRAARRAARVRSCRHPQARRLEAAIDRNVVIGRHRTLTQDSEFGIAQIVEIAIRALSPAVNDTFTGVACVDWLADALLALAENPPLEGNWYDTGGELRVWIPAVRIERLVKLAFDQIRQASATTPAVLIRQLDVIRRLAPRMPEAARRALADQADAIRDTATGAGRARSPRPRRRVRAGAAGVSDRGGLRPPARLAASRRICVRNLGFTGRWLLAEGRWHDTCVGRRRAGGVLATA